MARTHKAWTRTALALVAALAVFVQFGLGQAAMAQPAGKTIEVCTSHGTQVITVAAAPGDPAPAAPCSHCDHCLAPALAAAPAVLHAVESVRYAAARVEHGRYAAPTPYLARGPPRPPGQGPPQVLNL